jgi:hypothetical protein
MSHVSMSSVVMPGLVPGIHDFVLWHVFRKDVDGRNKSGHDGEK